MGTPTTVVAYLAFFTLVGVLFLLANLLVGYLLRPRLPNKEKLEVYECGEPVIGTSFVQFDLRFYVVALLFIIFDVEVAFFFPWATVYGKATQLAAADAPLMASDVDPQQGAALSPFARDRLRELGLTSPSLPELENAATGEITAAAVTRQGDALRQSARNLAWASFADIGVFFAVLMVGFAYVWKRGDLDWVRALGQPRPLREPRSSPIRTVEPSASILSA